MSSYCRGKALIIMAIVGCLGLRGREGGVLGFFFSEESRSPSHGPVHFATICTKTKQIIRIAQAFPPFSSDTKHSLIRVHDYTDY